MKHMYRCLRFLSIGSHYEAEKQTYESKMKEAASNGNLNLEKNDKDLIKIIG